MLVDTMGREVNNRLTPPPDPPPARRLADLLACRGREGLPWPSDGEFTRMAALAVAFTSSPNERVSWRAVFDELRDPVWKPAYERRLEVRRGLMS